MIFPRSFFTDHSTPRLAKALIGCFLEFRPRASRTPLLARIVETEAYLFRNDPACHAARGPTKRNAVMFGPAGRSYVYLIYGMYYCLNVVSGQEGKGEAVLLRALEPLRGIKIMQTNRRKEKITQLCNGPGRLTQAFALDKRHNDLCLSSSCLKLYSRDSFRSEFPSAARPRIITTTRIGINMAKDLPLRFLMQDSEFISKPPRL